MNQSTITCMTRGKFVLLHFDKSFIIVRSNWELNLNMIITTLKRNKNLSEEKKEKRRFGSVLWLRVLNMIVFIHSLIITFELNVSCCVLIIWSQIITIYICPKKSLPQTLFNNLYTTTHDRFNRCYIDVNEMIDYIFWILFIPRHRLRCQHWTFSTC